MTETVKTYLRPIDRDGLLASTGAGGVFALVAAALLGAGVLLRLRRRPGGHPDI